MNFKVTLIRPTRLMLAAASPPVFSLTELDKKLVSFLLLVAPSMEPDARLLARESLRDAFSLAMQRASPEARLCVTNQLTVRTQNTRSR